MSAAFEWGVHVLRPLAPEDAVALGRAGIGRVTVSVPWAWIEPGEGQRRFEAAEWFLRPLRGAALPLQVALGPAMPHVLPGWVLRAGGVDGDGFVGRFAASCATIAAALPDVAVFRVEAELNAAAHWERLVTRRRRGRRFLDGGFRAELLRAAVDAVRAARPDAELRTTVHAGLPGWRREVRRWLAAGVRLDRLGLTLQPCFALPDPELARRVGDALEDARAVVGALPLEIGRIGYATGGGRASPRAQREFLRIAADEAVGGGARGLHWWALRDQAHDDPSLGYFAPAQERAYGLRYYDGTPKPATEELTMLATGTRFAGGSS